MRRSAVKSAARTLQVLELFSERRCPLKLHDIHVALNYPQSSTTNLLKSMVMLGYLNYSRVTRMYLPTNRVALLGNWLPSFLYGQSDLQDLMEDLLRKTDETVALATQNDLYIQYVRIAAPLHGFKIPPPEGTMRLMTNSSAGAALLSQMSDAQVDKICRYINYYELDPGRVDPNEILRQVRSVRQLGYCFAPYRPTPATASVAFPLGEQLHGVPIAIGVGGLTERIVQRKTQLIDVCLEAIAGFKRRLHVSERAATAADSLREGDAGGPGVA